MTYKNGPPSIESLIAAVAARHGILFRPSEPAFALVTINQLLLEQSARDLTEQLDRRLKDFEDSVQRVELRAGKQLAQELKDAAEEVRAELRRDIDAARINAVELVNRIEAVHSRSGLIRWGAIGMIFGGALFACGVWLGHCCL